LNLSGNLQPDSTFVISNSSACTEVINRSDMTSNSLDFNGNDAVALVKIDTLDIIGKVGVDPGAGWDVAGTTAATENHTLIRKSNIASGDTIWTNSAGTDTTNSQWLVSPQDDFSNLGTHTAEIPDLTITTPNGGEIWNRDNTYTISWTSENFDNNILIQIIDILEADTTILNSSAVNDGEFLWQIPSEFPFSEIIKS